MLKCWKCNDTFEPELEHDEINDDSITYCPQCETKHVLHLNSESTPQKYRVAWAITKEGQRIISSKNHQ